MMQNNDGAVKTAAKVFWRTRHFWAMASLIVVACVLIGYLIGNWTASNGAKSVIDTQARAYKEASDARKTILAQCINNNAVLTSKLAALGDKTASALDKLADDTIQQNKQEPTK